ncbi:Scr1 family TA system antitoxin-like transcriptional regulator [Nocardiopsis alba]|jgi:transcriptional regulator with XRE-family HTH domain|uniref:helix-turn-helix domain-containing protein n=1 Tax=Nocardiopsis alba TaxID=53437 RepID=UPI0033AFE5E6
MKSSSGRGKGNPGNSQGGCEEEWARFGLRVRELREAAGLSVGDLSTREVCEGSTVQRIEKGDTDVPLYLAEYLDRRLKAQGGLVNAWARTKLNTHLATGGRPHELDYSASALREFHPGAFPPDLQSHDYATALAQARGIEERSTLGNRTSILKVVLNESVVRARVGGDKVMREQLGRIVTSMRGGGLCLQIIPADIADHPCPMGPFRLLSLGPVYTVAHLISPCGDGQLISRPDEVRSFSDLFEDLRGAALPVSESLDLITEVYESLKPQDEQKAITSGDQGEGLLSTLGMDRYTRH